MAPFLTLGATDARHYKEVAPHAYRFLPVNQPDVDRLGPHVAALEVRIAA